MTIHYPDDAAIAQIAVGIQEHSLPKSAWTHAAHFGAALWLLRHEPNFDGERHMPGIIRAYNIACGTENSDSSGYHDTITRASLHAARLALAAAPDTPLHVILDELMEGPRGRSDWLLRHWRRETLFSVAARRGWVAPDLETLPPLEA